jgi:putative Mn2+ efflux pump MntP
MQSGKHDLSEIACGIVMLLVGVTFLSGARSAALLQHTTIYFKGVVYPWQAIIGGSLLVGVGLFLVIHGFYRRKNSSGGS